MCRDVLSGPAKMPVKLSKGLSVTFVFVQPVVLATNSNTLFIVLRMLVIKHCIYGS